MGRNISVNNEKASATLGMLGAQLRARRKQLGLTMQQVALASGISRVTLQRIEQGEGSVSSLAIMQVAMALGTQLVLDGGQAEPLRNEILLSDYPGLSSLAWQLNPGTKLTPNEAWSLYTRNWRHLDKSLVSNEEQALLQKLQNLFGGAFDV